MTERRLQLHTLVQAFENGTVLGEALHYPEVSRLAENATRARRALHANSRGIAEATPLLELYRRLTPSTPTVREYRVELPPTKETVLWTEPLPLRFHAAVYEIPGQNWTAYFPALQLQVLAADEAELEQRIPAELLLALRRTRTADSLWMLSNTQRCEGLTVDTSSFKADIASPKELAVRASMSPKEPPVLPAVAQDLNAGKLPRAWEYDQLVRRLADALAGHNPQSVLLVGPSGAGKTAAFHELVRARAELGFAHTPFWATSGSRLVAGMSGFGMWQERCDKLRKEASRTRAIIHLGGLLELMEVGKGVMIQQGMAGFLRPYIARGELLCVVECTPEQLPLIEREDPHLLGVFKRIDVPEPAPEVASAILMNVAHELSAGKHLVELPALETIERLHRRYATYSAWPGRPLRFVRNLLADREIAATSTDVYAAFSRETGLPRLMLDAALPLDLPATRDWLRARVIGQDGALELVVDLLANIKAALSRPRKPLASLLLVGPTGVGKTETAKALAEFLFNDRRRITRFDMSEYGSTAAVQRLIGGAFGEQGLLTSRVREQPFSVLLFDEFEKAHPLFGDLLLQVLGEARLTDAAGRPADFSNTVVIMTSNLGAEGFMRGAIGFGAPQADAAAHFTRALKDFVRPELLNRIDRVVPFLPLDEVSVLAITRRELGLLQQRSGVAGTGTELTVTPAAEKLIATRGWQPALGARPLKREIERSLLVPLAEALNTQPTNYALRAVADVTDGDLALAVSPLEEGRGQRARAAATSGLTGLVFMCAILRRKLQAALASPAALRLRNEIYRLTRAIEADKRRAKKKGAPPARYHEAAIRLAKVRAVVSAFEAALEHTCELEDQLAFSSFGRPAMAEAAGTTAMAQRQADWSAALLALMRLDTEGGEVATLWIYSHNNELMFELAAGYFDWATAQNLRPALFWAMRELADADRRDMQRRADFDSTAFQTLRHGLERPAPKPDEPPMPVLYAPSDGREFANHPREETGGIAITLAGPDLAMKLRHESGVHRFRRDSQSEPVNVDVAALPADIWRAKLPLPRGMATEGEPRRRYELSTRQAQDEALGEVFAWTGNSLADLLGRCIEATFERELEKQVGL